MEGKRDWIRNLILALCVVLLILSLGQRCRISDLEQDIWNAQNSVISGPDLKWNKDGSETFEILNGNVCLYNDRQKVLRTTDNAFRPRRGGELAAERAAKQEEAANDYVAEGEFSTECRTGDVLTWTFFCRDESSVGYEFFLREWTVEADGLARNAEGTEWPKLTWD